jgi:signal transduction histidine kinase
MRVRSLRGRVLLASILWTVGLVLLLSMVFSHVFEHYPRARLMEQVHGFLQAPLVILGSTLCLLGALLHARRTQSSIDSLHRRLTSVQAGRARRMEGVYPSEVQPLVDDLNTLLDHREQAIVRAIAKAGDLAHGLKTPLAVLSQEAARARTAGQSEIADSVDQQVARMQRQVDYHLAHARAAASGVTVGTSASVKESVDGLTRALLRLHAERRLTIDANVPADLEVRVQREDLDEMLGNLLDNACKWARTLIVVGAGSDGAMTTITVDDDGCGIVEGMREAVLRRGVRADEAAPGSGLGLAIVRDLVELYGGSISLDTSPLGGLRASLRVPSRGYAATSAS